MVYRESLPYGDEKSKEKEVSQHKHNLRTNKTIFNTILLQYSQISTVSRVQTQ